MALRSNAPVTAGGRPGVDRLLLVSALVCAFAWQASAASEPKSAVTVREEAGLYRVVATFRVLQPAAIAMAVLTDYEHIPRFMPDVRRSTVLERSGDSVVVDQEAVARLTMFSKRIHLVLAIQERPGGISFQDRCGESFTRYEGGWTVERTGPDTTIEYSLTAQPSFDVPAFVLRRLLKRDSTRMIERLRAEIAGRGR